jgi:hypothetical protein
VGAARLGLVSLCALPLNILISDIITFLPNAGVLRAVLLVGLSLFSFLLFIGHDDHLFF